MPKDENSGKKFNKNLHNEKMENEGISNEIKNKNSEVERIDLTNGIYYI